MYDFTACIVTYNTPASDLERIIKCFQKIKLNFKLWISDNSETDNLKFFFEKTDDARIEYIFNNSNKGFGAGHNVVINKLISNSKISEFHLIINADIYFEENIIEKIVEYMKNHNEIGQIGPRIRDFEGKFSLCRRIGQKYKVIYFPEAEIFHEHGKASYKSRKLMMFHVKSATKYFNKWGWFFDKERKEKNIECMKKYRK